MQVALPENGKPSFPRGFGAALAKMSETKADTKFPFGSLYALHLISFHPNVNIINNKQ
jgi:hypothetical protein